MSSRNDVIADPVTKPTMPMPTHPCLLILDSIFESTECSLSSLELFPFLFVVIVVCGLLTLFGSDIVSCRTNTQYFVVIVNI